jgi:short-subunit dehydrogenase
MIHKTAVITGASEGIGRSLTKLLVNLGWEVVGISRNKKRLNELDKELSNSNGLFKYY